MPQMGPMMWVLLNILFISIILLTSTLIHFYINIHSTPIKYLNKNLTYHSWKW